MLFQHVELLHLLVFIFFYCFVSLFSQPLFFNHVAHQHTITVNRVSQYVMAHAFLLYFYLQILIQCWTLHYEILMNQSYWR